MANEKSEALRELLIEKGYSKKASKEIAQWYE
jgi:hypothetical protein